LLSTDTGEKKKEYNETIYKIFIDLKEANDSVGKEELYHILIKIGLPGNYEKLG
jgi:hypothetical protein